MEFVTTPALVSLAYRIQDAFQSRRSEFDPWIGEAAAKFEATLPIPQSCALFSADGFFRLKRHQRSFCFAPKGREPIRNVFCIKGMEPFAPDFGAALDKMAANRPAGTELNALEHLIVKEDKLPGCLLFSEACAEASIAVTVHQRLAIDAKPLPRLPLPVLCVRLPETTAQSAVREISARASQCLWPKIEMLAAAGLGAYVYWYPSLPLRAREFHTSRQSVVAMSDGWINLAARLLRAGFLPATAHSLGRGVCCDSRNSVIDGGFADIGSIVPVADVRRPQDVFIAMQITIREIAATILHVLGNDSPSLGSFDYGRQMVRFIVRARLARACAKVADPRLMQFFGATETVGSLARFLDET
jgi:hypothetical protein